MRASQVTITMYIITMLSNWSFVKQTIKTPFHTYFSIFSFRLLPRQTVETFKPIPSCSWRRRYSRRWRWRWARCGKTTSLTITFSLENRVKVWNVFNQSEELQAHETSVNFVSQTDGHIGSAPQIFVIYGSEWLNITGRYITCHQVHNSLRREINLL